MTGLDELAVEQQKAGEKQENVKLHHKGCGEIRLKAGFSREEGFRKQKVNYWILTCSKCLEEREITVEEDGSLIRMTAHDGITRVLSKGLTVRQIPSSL
jgi:hypothetical protein